MKKLLAILVAFVMMFALVGCGDSDANEDGNTPEVSNDSANDNPEVATVNLDIEVILAEVYYYSVSSLWEETDESDSTVITYRYFTDANDRSMKILDASFTPLNSVPGSIDARRDEAKQTVLDLGIYTNWVDISRTEIPIEGAQCIVYEWSFTNADQVEVTMISASMQSEGSDGEQFLASLTYTDRTETFDSEVFYAVLDTVYFSA